MTLAGALMFGLAACDSDDITAPGQTATGSEVEFSVDEDLAEAMFTDAEAELDAASSGVTPAPALFGEPDPTKIEEARALIAQARETMAEARAAWRQGDTELAAELAEQARRLVAQALLLVFGEEAVQRAMERINNLITWLEERVDQDNSELLARIVELRDMAQARWDEGDLEGALERLILARQIASRERTDHRRDALAIHARLSVFMANSAVDFAIELVGEPTERQAYGLRFANELVSAAEQAFENGRFRLAFNLAREAVNLTLVVVVTDPDLSDLETVDLMIGIAEGAIAAAEEAVQGSDSELALRLLEHARALKDRGIELAETHPRAAVRVLWHSAVLANGIVYLVS